MDSSIIEPPVSEKKEKFRACWRIQEVPSDWSREVLLENLQKIDKSLNDFNKGYLSLYPTVSPRDDFQVALLDLEGGSPEAFKSFSIFEVNRVSVPGCTDIDGRPLTLAIDCHFEGLTPLNKVKEEDTILDVVAVTGLAGHAFGSWKHREARQMWLQRYLSKEFERARIMTYGYNTQLTGPKTVDHRLQEYAEIFMNQLSEARPGAIKKRAIVFIGHSLGGILIQQTLLSSKNIPGFKHILDATCAIFFFGTPHAGLETGRLKLMVRDQLPKEEMKSRIELLEHLDIGSSYLYSLRTHLTDVMASRDIYTYIELRQTLDVQKNPVTGKWEPTARKIMRVPLRSNILFLPNEKKLSIDRDHRELVKFNGISDTYYRIFASHLQEVVEKIETKQLHDLKQISSANIQKRKEVLKWIFPEPFDTKHSEISTKRQKNTGKWLLELPEFDRWVNQKLPTSLLLMHGIPGAGKTYISSFVIDYLEAHSGYGVAYIYFDYKEQDQQTPILVLRSLLKQLICQIPQLPAKVEAFYDQMNRHDRPERPTSEGLYTAFLAARDCFSRNTFLVFDAVDEYRPEDQRRDILELFKRMENDGINILLTSRSHILESVNGAVSRAVKIEISASKEDIGFYAEEVISKNSQLRGLIEQATNKDAIVSELIDCAQGMFLLVPFHMRYLSQQTTGAEVLTALEELKVATKEDKPLNTTYDKAIDTIRQQPKNRKSLALKILSWLVKARRTLTFEEIQVAISVKENIYKLSKINLTSREIFLDVCASLVTIDEKTNVVRLAHYTVQEYLLESSLIPGDAEFRIALSCVMYLSFEIFSDTSIVQTKEAYPFLEYASKYSASHLKVCDESLTTDIVLSFLRRPGNVVNFLKNLGFYQPKETPIEPACILGHCAAVQTLLIEGADISAQSLDGLAPLHLAAQYGHVDVLRVLIGSGADLLIRRKGYEEGETALHIAAGRGHLAVVQLLIEMGTDLSVRTKNGKRWPTALHIATRNRHEAVARLLIEVGADFLAVEDRKSGKTVLDIAIEVGSDAIAQLVIEKGGGVGAMGPYGWTAIGYAAYSERERIVRLLLEQGEDIEARDRSGETVLHNAIKSKGGITIVQLLIDKGADILARNSSGESILHWAAYVENEQVVRLLVEKGVDILARDDHGRTLLHKVLWLDKGYMFSGDGPSIARFLISKGADVLALDNDGEPVLSLPFKEMNTEMFRLLIENGADISALDREGKLALHEAVLNRHPMEITRLLVEKGANIFARDSDGKTALHIVPLERGDHGFYDFGFEKSTALEIFQFLIGHGADIKARDNNGKTPLHTTATGGNVEVVQLLIEKGAEVTAVTNDGRTVLNCAYEKFGETEDEEVPMARLLIENGVDVSAKDSNGRTALEEAFLRGHLGMIRLLMEKGGGISVIENDVQTIFREAFLNGHPGTIKFLIEMGVDISTLDRNGATALHQLTSIRSPFSVAPNRLRVAQILIDNGANLSARDSDGKTPLHIAASASDQDLVELLIKNGADISVLDHERIYSFKVLSAIKRERSRRDRAGEIDLRRKSPSGPEPVFPNLDLAS